VTHEEAIRDFGLRPVEACSVSCRAHDVRFVVDDEGGLSATQVCAVHRLALGSTRVDPSEARPHDEEITLGGWTIRFVMTRDGVTL
jgi:hypothetical protein